MTKSSTSKGVVHYIFLRKIWIVPSSERGVFILDGPCKLLRKVKNVVVVGYGQTPIKLLCIYGSLDSEYNR